MTRAEMHTKLGLRLEDTGETNFTEATKDSALNTAQMMLANFLHEAYLTELEFKDTVSLTGTSGLITLGGAGGANNSSAIPIRNSVRAIQLVTSGVYRYAISIPFTDAKKIENEYLSADTVNPVYWIFGNNITYRPIGATSAVLYFLKAPATISDSQEPVLNVALHELMVDIAESELWRMDNKADRSQLAKASAMEQIKMLNDRYAIEQPVGVGHDMG